MFRTIRLSFLVISCLIYVQARGQNTDFIKELVICNDAQQYEINYYHYSSQASGCDSVQFTYQLRTAGVLQFYDSGDTVHNGSQRLQTTANAYLLHKYIFTSAPGYIGIDSILWTADCYRDSSLLTTITGICRLTIIPNTLPELRLLNIKGTISAGADINLSDAIDDITPHSLMYVLDSLPVNGSMHCYPLLADGFTDSLVPLECGVPVTSSRWHYTNTGGQEGSDYFHWHVIEQDTFSPLNAMIIDVCKNSVPIAESDSAVFCNNAVRSILELKFSDENHFQPLSIIVTELPKHGLLETAVPYPTYYADVHRNTALPASDLKLTTSYGRKTTGLLFTAVPGYEGRDTVKWCVSDGLLISDTALYIIHFTPNTPPTAEDKNTTVNNRLLIYIEVSNDPYYRIITDDTPGSYSFCLTQPPRNGSICSGIYNPVDPVYPGIPVTAGNIRISYTPDSLFWGADTFYWRVYEADTFSNIAQYTVTVQQQPYYPLKAKDNMIRYVQVKNRTSCTLFTQEGLYASIQRYIASPPRHGRLEYRMYSSWFDCPTGSFIPNTDDRAECSFVYYTPDSGYAGPDTFHWYADDGRTVTDTALFVILQDLPNTPPKAFLRTATLKTYDTEFPLTLYYSDSEATKGDSLQVDIITLPRHGTLNQLPILAYTPDYGFTGIDSFVWRVYDAMDAADTAVFKLTVGPNVVPVAQPPLLPIRIWRNTVTALELNAKDPDASQPVTFMVTSLPHSGSLQAVQGGIFGPVVAGFPMQESTMNAINTPAATHPLYYAPEPSFTGLDSFAWSTFDGMDMSDTVWTFIDVIPRHAGQGARREALIPPGVPVPCALPGPANAARYRLVQPPATATVSLYRDICTITGTPGHTGLDSFICIDTDSPDADTLPVRLLAHTKFKRGGQTVLIIADSTLYGELQPEIDRLHADMTAEGYTAEVIPWVRNRRNTLLWTLLADRYHTLGAFLSGAVLIGQVPWGWDIGSGYVSDFPYWNMESFDYASTPDIWVSRINATGYGGTPLLYGSETELIRRALDANHNYRTGKSRLPHTAFTAVYDSTADQRIWDGTTYNYGTNAADIWPHVVTMFEGKTSPDTLFRNGGEFFQSRGHGSGDGYWGIPLQMTTERVFASHSPLRVCMVEACLAGTPGGVLNAHLLARNTGTVIGIGASAQSTLNSFILLGDDPAQANCRARLKAGDSWGNALAGSFPFKLDDEVRPVYYGDLSLPVMPFPSNELPVITSFSADRVTGEAPLTVSFTTTATDGDGTVTRFEWFPEGYRVGLGEPAAVGSTESVLTHTYTEPDTYLVRVEAVDNYLARAYRELQVIVLPEGGGITVPPVLTGREDLPANTMLYRIDGTPLPVNVRPESGMYFNINENGIVIKTLFLP